MFARDLMKEDYDFCTLEDTASTAAEIMLRRNCGFVPILRDKTSLILEGGLTDRDLALYLAKTNRKAKDVLVKEFFTQDLKTVAPNDEIHRIKALMEEFHIHRIPVTESDGRLLGIISLKDLAAETFKERDSKMPEVTEKELAEIVEAISLSR